MSNKDTAAITVMRASDAKKDCIQLNMSQSLNDLKDAINRSTQFGPVDRTRQRIFHLGRELKSGNRSLGILGIGKFKNYTVVLHVKKGENLPAVSNNSSNNNKEKQEEVVTVVGNKRQTNREDRHNQQQQEQQQQQQQQRQHRQQNNMVDLLDDSDDDVEVLENPSLKRQRQR